MPGIASSLEDSGGFSIADCEKLSIHGASARWTRWTYQGIDISDPLFPGAAAIKLPESLVTTLAADALAHTLSFTRANTRPRRSQLGLQLALPSIGGITPGGHSIVRQFSATHPTDRDPPPPSERRAFTNYQQLHFAQDRAQFRYALTVDWGTRRFNSFAPITADRAGSFDDRFVVTTAGITTANTFALAEYRTRRHQFAELYYAPEETARTHSAAVVAGYTNDSLQLGATFRWLSIADANADFSRDILDPDGEALQPWYPRGDHWAVAANARWNHAFFYVQANQQLLLFMPAIERWSNALTFAGDPLGRFDWHSQTSLQTIGDWRIGHADQTQLGPIELDYDLHFTAAHVLNRQLENSLFLPDVAVSATARADLARAFAPYVTIAKMPVPLNADLSRLLDPDYLNGARFGGDQLLDTIGGMHVDVSPKLSRANTYTGAIGIQSALGNWRLTAEGLFRIYSNTYWLAFAHDGSAQRAEEDNRWYLTPGAKRYQLINYPLDQIPFYMGFSLALQRTVADRFLFDLSFTALNAIGGTAFGIGPTANDLGVVDYSMANPNSRVNELANLDGDRAFVLKGRFGYQLFDQLQLLAAVRHKDGKPFAFYEVTRREGDWASTYTSKRGSPLKYSRPLAGPRHDFRLNVDLEVRYALAFSGVELEARAVLANALDLGTELAERSNEAGRAGRAPLELELPRTLIVGIDAKF